MSKSFGPKSCVVNWDSCNLAKIVQENFTTSKQDKSKMCLYSTVGVVENVVRVSLGKQIFIPQKKPMTAVANGEQKGDEEEAEER